MAEIQEHFPTGTSDPEATLVQPRFDEAESQIAQPVVPLSHETRRAPRSRLPVALVLVSALLGGLVSVLAYRLYQRPARQQAQPVAQQQEAQPSTEQAATQTAQQQPAPAQTPELTAAAPAPEEPAPREEAAPAPAPSKHEESAVVEEKSPRVVEKKHDEETPAREERRRDDEPRAVRVAEPRARKVDVIPSYRDDDAVDERDTRRVGASDYELPNDARRERRRARRQKSRNIDRIRDIFGAPPPG